MADIDVDPNDPRFREMLIQAGAPQWFLDGETREHETMCTTIYEETSKKVFICLSCDYEAWLFSDGHWEWQNKGEKWVYHRGTTNPKLQIKSSNIQEADDVPKPFKDYLDQLPFEN